MELDQLLESTLKVIKPSSSELQSLQKASRELLDVIQKCSPQAILKNTVAGGGVAKGTFLAGTSDIDLFAQLKVKNTTDLRDYIYQVGKCLKKTLRYCPH